MVSRFYHVQLFMILGIVAGQASLSVRFSRQEHWSGLTFPPPGDLPNQGLNACLMFPALAGGFFTSSTTWEALLRGQGTMKPNMAL